MTREYLHDIKNQDRYRKDWVAHNGLDIKKIAHGVVVWIFAEGRSDHISLTKGF